MGAVKESIMAMGERGYVPISKEDQYRWQEALDRILPVTGVAIDLDGEQIVENGLPAAEARAVAGDQRIDARDRDSLMFLLEVAGLEDENASVAWWVGRRMAGLADEVATAERRLATSTAATAARLAGEIVAAVARGDDLPEEWHRLDAYADIGEPVAAEVCRLVRDDLAHTGIRP